MVTPNQTQMNEFLEGDIDSPISMVNLLKFKKKLNTKMAEILKCQGRRLIRFMLLKFKNI